MNNVDELDEIKSAVKMILKKKRERERKMSSEEERRIDVDVGDLGYVTLSGESSWPFQKT